MSEINYNTAKKLKRKDMHIRNYEFRRQLNTKFKDHQRYKIVSKEIANRPELGPFYIVNVKSKFELGPGHYEEEEAARITKRETLQIISKLNFQQLGQNQLGRRSSSVSESSEIRNSINDSSILHFSFNSNSGVKVRNFTPTIMNKNVNYFSSLVELSNQYW